MEKEMREGWEVEQTEVCEFCGDLVEVVRKGKTRVNVEVGTLGFHYCDVRYCGPGGTWAPPPYDLREGVGGNPDVSED